MPALNLPDLRPDLSALKLMVDQRCLVVDHCAIYEVTVEWLTTETNRIATCIKTKLTNVQCAAFGRRWWCDIESRTNFIPDYLDQHRDVLSSFITDWLQSSYGDLVQVINVADIGGHLEFHLRITETGVNPGYTINLENLRDSAGFPKSLKPDTETKTCEEEIESCTASSTCGGIHTPRGSDCCSTAENKRAEYEKMDIAELSVILRQRKAKIIDEIMAAEACLASLAISDH